MVEVTPPGRQLPLSQRTLARAVADVRAVAGVRLRWHRTTRRARGSDASLVVPNDAPPVSSFLRVRGLVLLRSWRRGGGKNKIFARK